MATTSSCLLAHWTCTPNQLYDGETAYIPIPQRLSRTMSWPSSQYCVYHWMLLETLPGFLVGTGRVRLPLVGVREMGILARYMWFCSHGLAVLIMVPKISETSSQRSWVLSLDKKKKFFFKKKNHMLRLLREKELSAKFWASNWISNFGSRKPTFRSLCRVCWNRTWMCTKWNFNQLCYSLNDNEI